MNYNMPRGSVKNHIEKYLNQFMQLCGSGYSYYLTFFSEVLGRNQVAWE
jgi:hypothetical protein